MGGGTQGKAHFIGALRKVLRKAHWLLFVPFLTGQTAWRGMGRKPRDRSEKGTGDLGALWRKATRLWDQRTFSEAWQHSGCLTPQ